MFLHVYVLLGTCTCGAGFTGELCEFKCDSGKFGLNCEQKCQCEIGNYFSCDPINGKCICKPEWKGIFYIQLIIFHLFLFLASYHFGWGYLTWCHLLVLDGSSLNLFLCEL